LEYCPEGELFDRIFKTKSGMSETAARVILSQTIVSYAHLHKLGYAHNDLKPENIVMDGSFNVKIIDFGSTDPITTQSKKYSVGTTIYFSPEKMKGFKKHEDREVFNNYHADVYSLGLIF